MIKSHLLIFITDLIWSCFLLNHVLPNRPFQSGGNYHTNDPIKLNKKSHAHAHVPFDSNTKGLYYLRRFPDYHKRVSKHRNYASEHVTQSPSNKKLEQVTSNTATLKSNLSNTSASPCTCNISSESD